LTNKRAISHIIVDAHCDTLSLATKLQGDLLSLPPPAQVDFTRLLEAKVNLQFFASFVDLKNPPALRQYLHQIEFFLQQVEKYKGVVHLVRRAADIDQAIKTGRLAVLLSIEGGEALEGDLGILQLYWRLGVRSLGLTWNYRNSLADGVGEEGTKGGLTKFGRLVVKEMNRLGMLIDLAHMSEAGFWEVIELSDSPVIVSHANCRKLQDHPRNLTDAQLKGLAQKKGVLGITLVNQFLGPGKPGVEAVLDHIEHAVEVMGFEHVGIGTDFDGVDEPVRGLENASCWPFLIQKMQQRGFPENVIEHVCGKNYLRVIRSVLE
jgi:membrane dipeptidase